LVGTGRFELPTPRTPSECSTRLSHVPTRKDSTDATVSVKQPPAPAEGFTQQFYTTSVPIDACLPERSEGPMQLRQRNAEVLRSVKSACLRMTLDRSWLLEIPPIRPDAHLHLKRHCQRVYLLHVLADQGLHNFHFVLGNFKNQFVVNL
jgi:hypothetical protein